MWLVNLNEHAIFEHTASMHVVVLVNTGHFCKQSDTTGSLHTKKSVTEQNKIQEQQGQLNISVAYQGRWQTCHLLKHLKQGFLYF